MLITILAFFLILSILVLVHELGHFFVAKMFNIKVEEFGFGFPPRVWSKKIGETLYSFNLLPIGGFVKLYG
ncbi:MAG TPA: RIP metalloprotease RseP, partial [Candidatus Levybacteria bacterium]|nr:RIP metalloprotease RseP [Candidatus Levybacteria bacterium]